MERLIEGGSAFDDVDDDIRDPEDTDDYDMKGKSTGGNDDSEMRFEPYAGEPSFQRAANTPKSAVGPKAVLADYQEAKHRMYVKHEKQRADLQRMANKNSFTVLSSRKEEILAQKEKQVEQQLEELTDDDDEFFRQYREMRMKQWREQQIKRYGELIHITKEEFLDEIDHEPKSTYIVLHLYETYYNVCALVNDCLKKLAQRHTNTKFLKAISTDLKPNWDPVALPSLVIYRGGGEYVKSYIRLTEELGEKFTYRDIEELLASDGILELIQD